MGRLALARAGKLTNPDWGRLRRICHSSLVDFYEVLLFLLLGLGVLEGLVVTWRKMGHLLDRLGSA